MCGQSRTNKAQALKFLDGKKKVENLVKKWGPERSVSPKIDLDQVDE